MARGRSGRGGCAILLFLLFFGLPLLMLLVSPAIAAHVAAGGSPVQAPYLSEWLWASAGSVPVALVLVRWALRRDGRLRGRGTPVIKRWLGLLARSGVLLGAMNVVAFLKLRSGEHVIEDGMGPLALTALAGVGALVAIRLWDRRPQRVTVQEVRSAAAEADRALLRVRAENERVRRQAAQVQARLTKIRARGTGPAGRPSAGSSGPGRPGQRPDTDFYALRTFHRESYQCADTAHLTYQSAQTSLHTMSYLVRRARFAPHRVVARRARAEMYAAADALARSHGELRVQVDQGLEMVRTLNANTSELKCEIRDSCGEQGQEWFEALEERIEKAREERGAGRM
ncbi:hypothetical protein C8D88_104349 [Lentzea atacamensis]|uniref:Uncharacterized protein n=1 Tax=Lentzea atacamensis TaxID=531938 RepID=A0A316I3W4_9PSEU|nr:hypothetical protein [Lentzea atacamensis]PWK87188.1 hypothetical protein C8D88_104349 [Lentzea atacamensis]